jgi:LacI family transcriptional regulator
MATPTYREIAEVCGVSSSTVSRALNRHHSIPKATQKRILAAAEKLGWEPNPLASAYMSHLRSTRPPSFKAILGAIVDYPAPNGLKDLPSHIRFRYEGFARRAMEYGYQVRAFNLQDSDYASASRVDSAMFKCNIPGFVITGLCHPRVILEDLNWSRYAAVSIGYSVLQPELHRVSMNVTQGFKLIIDRAFALGYRRLAVAVPEEYNRRTNHGLLMPACHAKLNLKRGQSLEILKVTETGIKEIEAIARWLRKVRPDYAVGPGVYEAINFLGWKIPGDLAMATFDRSPGFPEHAGLEQRHEAAGCLAADILISEITHNRRGIPSDPVEHLFHGNWIDAASVPRRRVAAE